MDDPRERSSRTVTPVRGIAPNRYVQEPGSGGDGMGYWQDHGLQPPESTSGCGGCLGAIIAFIIFSVVAMIVLYLLIFGFHLPQQGGGLGIDRVGLSPATPYRPI